MNRQDICERLCSYDPRNPISKDLLESLETIGAEPAVPGGEYCGCDNCFYGRHRLAEALLNALDTGDTARPSTGQDMTGRRSMSKGISFTEQELDTLFEAVEKWEREDPMARMAGGMMLAMSGRMDMPEEDRKKLEKEVRDQERKQESETRLRKERGVLLRAKIVQLKQGMAVDQFCEDAARETC